MATDNTSKDNVVTSVGTSEGKGNKTDDEVVKVNDSVKDTVISTTNEPAAPAVGEGQEEATQPMIPNYTESVEGKEEKTIDGVEKELAKEEGVKETSSKPTTEASSAEVSMEMDDLVVHTVEDDFKIEEQSRTHVSKKSGEVPSSTTDEQVRSKSL